MNDPNPHVHTQLDSSPDISQFHRSTVQVWLLMSLKLSLHSFLLMTPNCSGGRKHPGKPPHPWCYRSYFFPRLPINSQWSLHHIPKSRITFWWSKIPLRQKKKKNLVAAFYIQRRVWIKSSRDPSVKEDWEPSEWRHSKSALKAIPGMFVNIRRHDYKQLSQLGGSCRATIWPNCLTLIQKSNTTPAGPVCPFLE